MMVKLLNENFYIIINNTMYRLRLRTNVWDCTIKSKSKELPEWEFIEVTGTMWQVFINRNQILFYDVRKIDEEPKENKNQND